MLIMSIAKRQGRFSGWGDGWGRGKEADLLPFKSYILLIESFLNKYYISIIG